MQVLIASEISRKQALKILQEGGVIAHATETCYGLACDMTNPKAVEKLFSIKKRPLDQPVSALFPSVEEVKKWVEWNDEAEELAKDLPGPLTLILPLRKEKIGSIFTTPLPATSYPLPATIGIRVSSYPLAQALAEAFGKPLSTTSANLHGLPSPYSAEEISEQYSDEELQPDLIIDSGILARNPPSKIVDLTGDTVRTVRS